MSGEVIVAAISAAAVILAAAMGAVGAVVASRTRLPRQLQQAGYLARELEAMASDSAEQRLARKVHDDLVVDWALGQANHSYEDLTTVARSLTRFGAVIGVSGVVGLLATFIVLAILSPASLTATSAPMPPESVTLGAVAVAAMFAGAGVLVTGALLFALGTRGHFKNMAVIRGLHDLRDSAATTHEDGMKAHRRQVRAEAWKRFETWWSRMKKTSPQDTV